MSIKTSKVYYTHSRLGTKLNVIVGQVSYSTTRWLVQDEKEDPWSDLRIGTKSNKEKDEVKPKQTKGKKVKTR